MELTWFEYIILLVINNMNISRIRNICAKIKMEMKYHTVAMTRFPGDTATPKHESNASLEGCKEKNIFDL